MNRLQAQVGRLPKKRIRREGRDEVRGTRGEKDQAFPPDGREAGRDKARKKFKVKTMET